jgi:hypothetical protein
MSIAHLLRSHRPLLLALALCVSASGAWADPYPTDLCVGEKLLQAARYGRASLQGTARPGAARNLARAWASAEATSEAAGVDCAETTVSASEMADRIDQEAADLGTWLGQSEDGGSAGSCASLVMRAAGVAVQGLVAAEGRHLQERSSRDRDGARRARARERSRTVLRRTLAGALSHCEIGPTAEEIAARVEGIATRVNEAATISPNAPAEWTVFEPEPVEYEGRLYEPICSKGTPYYYFAKRGTNNKLLVYFQGGGACWDAFTCEIYPTYKQTVDPVSDNPGNLPIDPNDPTGFGFANFTNPDNPFYGWNVVFVPYCTGDVHWGDARYPHEFRNSTTGELIDVFEIEHKGYVNSRVVEKWTREHFVDPEQVFVTGSSAGAYGAIVNSLPLQENVYPSADFAVLGDAGNGVITQDFLENDISKWGIEKNLPAWIPGLNRPLTELNAADLWVESARFYPTHRFATYTTAYDGGTGGQTGFFHVMRNPGNPLSWLNWWEDSCDWNAAMLDLNADAAARAENFRYYVGSGSAHTMWGRPRVYSDTTGGVPPLVDWVKAMIAGSDAWVDVQAQDFGVLLPGDPRPNPTLPPFTGDGRIVCGE